MPADAKRIVYAVRGGFAPHNLSVLLRIVMSLLSQNA